MGVARDTHVYLLVSAQETTELFAGPWSLCPDEAAHDMLLRFPFTIVKDPAEDDAGLGSQDRLRWFESEVADLRPSEGF